MVEGEDNRAPRKLRNEKGGGQIISLKHRESIEHIRGMTDDHSAFQLSHPSQLCNTDGEIIILKSKP